MDSKNHFTSEHAQSGAAEEPDAFAPHDHAALEQAPERRDWGAAIELVEEACEAIRLAEAHAQSAQDYSKQLIAHHKEQIKAAEARTAAAEQRAELAQQRAVEAEMWLARLHDAIVDGFARR